MSRVLAVSALLLATLPSCAGDKALLITGESLVATGDQFVAVAAAMDKAVDAKVITVAQFRKWAAFARKFKLAYPIASNLWTVAADNRDERLQAQAAAAVAGLVAELGAFALLVGVK